jgi:hypothetical protein
MQHPLNFVTVKAALVDQGLTRSRSTCGSPLSLNLGFDRKIFRWVQQRSNALEHHPVEIANTCASMSTAACSTTCGSTACESEFLGTAQGGTEDVGLMTEHHDCSGIRSMFWLKVSLLWIVFLEFVLRARLHCTDARLNPNHMGGWGS